MVLLVPVADEGLGPVRSGGIRVGPRVHRRDVTGPVRLAARARERPVGYAMLLGARIVDEIVSPDGQWDQALGDTFGPSPEECARQAQQGRQQGDRGGN
ncbi:hypothetical protein GCM10010350_37940 [Streptomyces galilaeus]|nr:hypothetical protein GCM10010350_37940 [Streptomyces galilaeus]